MPDESNDSRGCRKINYSTESKLGTWWRLRYGTLPRRKRPRSKITIVLRRNNVAAKIEQILDGGVNRQETLALLRRFKTTHAALPNAGRLI